jgi:hypothetical protein
MKSNMNNNTNNTMNTTFNTFEIQDLIKNFADDSFKNFVDDFLGEEPASFYTDLLNSALELAEGLPAAKEKIVKVFRNKATRMIFVNAVTLATNASEEAKAIGIQIPFTSLLIDLAEIA